MGFAPIPRATMIASIHAIANELLDFVMSLVRDPMPAARYRRPAQAIADAHLNGVTSADVNNLLPMVSGGPHLHDPGPGLSGHGDASVCGQSPVQPRPRSTRSPTGSCRPRHRRGIGGRG